MISIFTQSTHCKIDYSDATKDERIASEKILNSKFCARDTSMARNPLVKKRIISDIKSFYNVDYNILPIGFLPFLDIYYKKANLEFQYVEMRKFVSPNKEYLKRLLKNELIFGKWKEVPRDYQIESVYEVVKMKGGIVELPTSSGKSLVMAILLQVYNTANIICLFNTIDLIQQTYDKLIDYGIDSSELGVIQGSNCDDSKRITLLSVQSYEKAFNLFPYANIIIADEVHETGRNTVPEKIVYSCQNAPIHIGLSATPWNDNPYETMRLYSNFGPVIYRREMTEQIESEALSETEVEIYSYESDPIQPCGTWTDIYDTKKVNVSNTEEALIKNGYTIVTEKGRLVGKKFLSHGDEWSHVINNEPRNKKIIEIIEKYVKQGKRILVLYNIIEHGNILQSLYPNGILIHGEHDNDTRKKAEMLIREKEGAVVFASAIWKKGIDIEQIDVFINAGAGKSSVNVIQKLGRVVRKSRTTDKDIAIAIDFNDSHLSFMARRQYEKRINIYQKKLKLPVRFL